MRRLQLVSIWRSLALAAAAVMLVAGGARAQTPVQAVGLSTVRAQKFGNENLLGFYTPQPQDQFGFALATGDFNGDGADDLATGMPFDDGLTDSPIADSGSVVVRYGVPGAGLRTNLAATVLRQTPAVDPPEEGDRYGDALASCDFNGDGFDDLAVGIRGEDHVGRENTGGVQVHFGGTNGLPTSGQQFYTQSTTGMPGDADEFDLFGYSLACGDFNADGFADLVIGIPGNDRPNGFGALGMVDIVPGTASGLDPIAATSLTQDTDGMGGDGEYGDYFGTALAVGDFDGDGFDDLAVGSPGEDEGKGAIHVVFGGRGGLAPAGSRFWMETFLGGSSEDYDEFGDTLASADFDGDGFDDLAIGIPWDDIGAGEWAVDAGWIGVLFGADNEDGFDLSRNQFLSEDHIWNAVMAEPNDGFGFSLAAGDFDRDGLADLAVGHPFETLAGAETGAVTILMGTADGLSNAEGIANSRARVITAGADGFPGELTQPAKYFAFALASGDFDGDGHADLAIGAPREDVDGIINVGTETVLYSALFADGVENGDTSLWSSFQSGGTTTLEVTKDARLGPSTSNAGLQINLGGPSRVLPATAFVRVGPDRGFNNERTLKGSFFVDPQNLTMSSTGGLNVFQMMAFDDGVGQGSRTRLAFDMFRTPTNYSFVANFHNDATNGLQAAGSGVIANAGDPNGHNTRLEFDWRAGNPGHLTMWRTRFVNGVPDQAGRVELFSVDLPGMGTAVINNVKAGVILGQSAGTSGKLFLDELSFRR